MAKVKKKAVKKKVTGRTKPATSQTRYFFYGVVFLIFFVFIFYFLLTVVKPVTP